MVSTVFISLAQSSLYCLYDCRKLSLSKTLQKQTRSILLNKPSSLVLRFGNHPRLSSAPTRRPCPVYFFSRGNDSDGNLEEQERRLEWPILKRWDVPWQWQTVSLTYLACGLSFVLTGLVGTAALPYLGIKVEELSLDEKSELLLLDQGLTTSVVLVVLFGITNSFRPLPADVFRYDLREPFDPEKGWLLWAWIGLFSSVLGVALTGIVSSLVRGETPEREADALVRLLPLIGSSSISTVSLVGITGVLAPILEETVFRGFLLVSLTKWVSTPLAVLISASAFALAHLVPGEFPQLFVLGLALGFTYAQTRNLLTPITIHAFWNSGVVLILTFLQLQGYDIKELLQAN